MADKTVKKEEEVDPKDLEIVFFDKDNGRILDRSEVARVGTKYVYKNKKTGSKNVAFGTKRSVLNFYRLDDDGKPLLKRTKEEERELKSKSRGPGSA